VACRRAQARAQKVNLRVTAISPGMVETEFYQVSHFNDKNKTASTPYQNMKCLQAEDIAQVCLCSAAPLPVCTALPACRQFPVLTVNFWLVWCTKLVMRHRTQRCWCKCRICLPT